MIKYLRMWRDDPNKLFGDDRTVEQEISYLLEGYICECLVYGPRNVRGWWSDGVVLLEIDAPSTNRFHLIGVTWIGCMGRAPFEIDIVLDPRRDDCFANCIFRLGLLDTERRPVVCAPDYPAARVLDMRPQNNHNWAMAVELAPSNES